MELSPKGLPLNVQYCSRCVESNQRMVGSSPFRDQKTSVKDTVTYTDGVCSACNYFDQKELINWSAREAEFRHLLDGHRRGDGRYDVVVPGSGGKDSRYTAHVLKHHYGMNPLTVTWSPAMYTGVGWRNFQSWGFDNVLFTPSLRVHRILTRLAFKNLLHPFQPFVFGQHSIGARVALEKGIKLVLYGDWYPEKGTGGTMKMEGADLDPRLYASADDDLFFGGVHITQMDRHGLSRADLNPYLPLWQRGRCIAASLRLPSDWTAELDVQYMPYYLDYDPDRCRKYSIERTGFEVNPDERSEGTYTRYQSLDDKVDGFHHYTWFIKTGRGRCTEDASLDIRNGHMTREEAVRLVRQYDGEFPQKYFSDFLAYIRMEPLEFWAIIDSFRPEHIWTQARGEWVLRQQVT